MKSTLLIAVISTGLVGVPASFDDGTSIQKKEEPQDRAVTPAFGAADEQLDLKAAHNGAPELEGRWLKQVITIAESSAGPVGTIEVRTTTYQLVDVEQNGREIKLDVQTCAAQMSDDSSMVSTGFSETLVQSLDSRSRLGRLYRRNGAWFLGIERDWELIGMTMEAPEEEELPTEPDDPRVFDQDGDGNPGFTIQISGIIDGEVYVARRGWDQFMGRLNGDGAIQGRVKWQSEEKVLDASRRMLRSSPDSVPNSEKSRFRMQRISGDIDCDTVEERKDRLFDAK